MTATGISFIRLAQGVVGAPAGSFAWLVSLEPVTAPPGAQTSPADNYYVIAVTATKGHFIADAHAYTSS
jgi:hypothetical protein